MTLMAAFILCTPEALTSALFYLNVIRRMLVFFTTNDTESTGPPAAFIYDTPVGSSGPAWAVRKRLTWITAVTGQETLTRPLVTTCENWPFLKATSILCHVENTMKILLKNIHCIYSKQTHLQRSRTTWHHSIGTKDVWLCDTWSPPTVLGGTLGCNQGTAGI